MKTILLKTQAGKTFQAGLADSYFLRLRGLIGRRCEELGGLVIKPCSQIHTCFMKEDIDAVYLTRDGLVLKADEALAPWRFFAPVKGARQVLELPAGKAAALGIIPGTTLTAENR